MSAREKDYGNQALGTFFLRQTAALHLSVGGNDAFLQHLRNGGRLLRIQLCRGHPVRSPQSHLALHNGARGGGIYDRFRRHRPGFQDFGRRQAKAGQRIFFDDDLCRYCHRPFPGHPGAQSDASGRKAHGSRRRAAGICRAVRQYHNGRHADLYAAVRLPAIYGDSRKGAPGALVYRRIRADEYVLRLAFHRRLRLGDQGCRRCDRAQSGRRLRAAYDIFPAPQQQSAASGTPFHGYARLLQGQLQRNV